MQKIKFDEFANNLSISEMDATDIPQVVFTDIDLSDDGKELSVDYYWEDDDGDKHDGYNHISATERQIDHLEIVTDDNDEYVIAWGLLDLTHGLF